MKDLQTSDAKAYSENIRSGIQELIDHIKKDISRVPKGESLIRDFSRSTGWVKNSIFSL